MNDGEGYAIIFAVLIFILVAGVYLAIKIQLAVEKRDREDEINRQVNQSEMPGTNKLEPESLEQFRDKWGLGKK